MAKKDKKPIQKQRGKGIQKTVNKAPVSFWSDKATLLSLLIILGITALVYSQSLKNEFVNWDDDVNLLENKTIEKLDQEHIKKIFTSHVIGNYNPLPIFTFAIEKHFFGIESARIYHINNLILHLICVLLVYRLGFLLGLGRYGAFILALLFGIHPMRVESVAWVTERKDVLFAAFYFGALIQYIHYRQRGRKAKHLALILVFFILSLLAKIQAVSLPLSMLAIDYYLNRPLKFKLVLEKAHYFALSLLFGLIGIYFLKESASLDQTKTAYNFAQRLSIGAYSYITYLYKLVVPYPMSPLYPYPKNIPWYIYASFIPALGVIGAGYVAFRKNIRPVVFGLAFFTFNIMFLLQIVGAGQGFLADRFTYVAYFGLFFIVAYYAEKYLFSSEKLKTIGFAGFGLLFAVHAVASIQQIKIWENGGTLWTHVLKYYKNVTLPYGNRANFYRDRNMNELALADYNEAIRLEGAKATTYNSRGKLFFNQQEFARARVDYDEAIRLDPSKAEYWINRAAALASLGLFQEALVDANKGLEIDPTNINGYRNRFLIYQSLDLYEPSIPDIDKLIENTPWEANLYYEKARAYRVLGRTAESLPFYGEALKREPDNTLFLVERGKALLAVGNKPAARVDIQRAAQLGQQIDPALWNQLDQ